MAQNEQSKGGPGAKVKTEKEVMVSVAQEMMKEQMQRFSG